MDDFQSFTLNNNQRILLSFQWDNPFLSHTGGAASATTDMDIYVLNSANQIVAGSAASNGGGDPLELFSFTNTTGSTQTYNLMMVRFGGPVPSFVKYINITNGRAGMGALQFATNSGTAYGHANADLGMSIGAAFYGNTPEFGANPAQAEPFSSAGGIPIRFDDVGNPIVPVIRQNPDVVGPDGANTTFFGGDIAADADSFPNFFGTSAATPHVAALAAIIRQANPGISVSALNNTLRSTAQDMDDASTGGFDVGYDTGTGFGFVNGPAAIAAGPAGPFPVTFAGTSSNDILRVVRNGANTEFYRGGVLQFSFPASEIANITINGGNGSDTLTLDYTFGNPSPAGAINFAGGESAGDDDRLVVTGYNVPNLTVNHTGPEAGNITSGSFTINFSEIEPLALSGTAADLIINFPAGPNNAVLGDDTNANFPALGLGLANTSAIDAPTFEYTSFTNPTNSLSVNFGANGDTLTMRAMDATFSPAGASPVTINGGAGIDTVNVVATNAGVTTTINGGGSLDVINIGNTGVVGTPGLLTPVAGPVIVDGQAGGADLTVESRVVVSGSTRVFRVATYSASHQAARDAGSASRGTRWLPNRSNRQNRSRQRDRRDEILHLTRACVAGGPWRGRRRVRAGAGQGLVAGRRRDAVAAPHDGQFDVGARARAAHGHGVGLQGAWQRRDRLRGRARGNGQGADAELAPVQTGLRGLVGARERQLARIAAVHRGHEADGIGRQAAEQHQHGDDQQRRQSALRRAAEAAAGHGAALTGRLATRSTVSAIWVSAASMRSRTVICTMPPRPRPPAA